MGRGIARMRRRTDHVHPGSTQTPVELQREHQVGELGLAIGQPALVAARIPVEVVGIDTPERMGQTRHGDHARAGCGPEPVQQTARQCEVAEVVGADLHLEPIGRAAQGQRHDTRIVDQNIQPFVTRTQIRDKRFDARQVGKIQRHDLQARRRVVAANLFGRMLALADVATGQHHLRTGASERTRRFQPQAAVRARYDRSPACEMGDVRNVPTGHFSPSLLRFWIIKSTLSILPKTQRIYQARQTAPTQVMVAAGSLSQNFTL